MTVYACTVHHTAKTDRNNEWSTRKYHAAYRLRKRVHIQEAACPSCIEDAHRSLHSIIKDRMEARDARQLLS